MAEFALSLDPCEKILFSSKTLGEEAVVSTLTVSNPLTERVAVKVKCTSNDLFRIRPPVFCVNPNEKTSVTLTFNSGKPTPDNGKHYFAVYYIKPTGESIYPRTAWTEHKGEPAGIKRIYVDFNKGDDEKKESAEKEEKKEDKKEELNEEKKAEEQQDEKKKDDKEEDGKDDKKDDKDGDDKEGKEEKKDSKEEKVGFTVMR